MDRIFSSLIFMFQHTPQLHRSEAMLQLSEKITLFAICCIYTHHQRRGLDGQLGFGGHHFYMNCTRLGTGRNLVAPLLVFLLAHTFCLQQRLNFLLERKELISRIKLVKNFNLDNSYSKPECHVLSKAFSIYKNTAAIDIFLLKFKVTWSISLID
jgi:hypothetical protein